MADGHYPFLQASPPHQADLQTHPDRGGSLGAGLHAETQQVDLPRLCSLWVPQVLAWEELVSRRCSLATNSCSPWGLLGQVHMAPTWAYTLPCCAFHWDHCVSKL